MADSDIGGKFPLGRTVATRGALEALTEYDIALALTCHRRGDWGEVSDGDRAANERALCEGDRLLSVYRSTRKVRFYVITEWDRSVTTILLPHEY